MLGQGEKFTHLFGKSYVWVRDDDGKLHLKRITPEAILNAIEEADKAEAGASA